MPSYTGMDSTSNDVAMDGEDHPMHDANGYSAVAAALNGPDSNSASADYEAAYTTTESEYEDEDEYAQGILIPLRDRRLLPTGVCYDDRMKLHANADWSPEKHPEDPQRIEAIFNTFRRAGLIFTGSDDEMHEVYQKSPTKYMWRIPCRKATKEEIRKVHTETQYQWAEDLKEKSTEELRELTRLMDQGRASLYVGGMTFEAALLSAGGAIQTCVEVVKGNMRNAFAVIRPPGHHAEFNESMGFCVFNNVPVATMVCRERYAEICRKVLILDWDVHHGNGIQNIFYNDPNVLYISLHVYQDGSFYPGQPDVPGIPDGGIQNVGSGAAKGRNVNIGWHDQGMGDGEYMAAFQQIVMPIAKEFNPDFVIISAGFDAADGDELGGCFVSPKCYAHMTHMLMSLANGKVAVCLEGGYNLRAISTSALEVARTLMGEPPPQMQIPQINKQAARVLKMVQAAHAPYWECMRPGIVDVPQTLQQGSQRLDTVLRLAQRQALSEKFGMYPLYLQRSSLYKAMENQVLVTPGFEESRRLIILIHDPPEMKGQPDPLEPKIEAHNAFMTDPVPRYIEWAANQGFAIMDINVLARDTNSDDNDFTMPRQDAETLQNNIVELVCFLWDNYLQLHRAEKIFLMGIGDAYLGVKVLLINRDCKSRISGIVNFVTGILRPIKSDRDPGLSAWYKDHSLVLVTNDHACWSDQGLIKKVQKRRFGSVTKADVSGLARMMDFHLPEVEAWILQRVGEVTPVRRGTGTSGGRGMGSSMVLPIGQHHQAGSQGSQQQSSFGGAC